MTTVSTARSSNQTAAAAAALVMSFGANFYTTAASTAYPLPGYTGTSVRSDASTDLTGQPFTQLTRAATPDTRLPEFNQVLPWQDILLAGLQADQLLKEFSEDLETDESLERFEITVTDFLDQYGRAGVAALVPRLLRSQDETTEVRARRFLRALGAKRNLLVDRDAAVLLLTELDSPSPGRRSAAASALGAFPSKAILKALEVRHSVETNRIVLATLSAHIRVFRANGITSTKAV